MANYPKPPKSKRAVREAGKAIAEGNGNVARSNIDLVDQWRAAHGYVINNFQIFLKNRLKKHGVSAEFAQRLKRRKTVIDKLKRPGGPNGKRLISDVTSMHDLAGCRLIFKDMKSLHSFRDFVISAESMKTVKHVIKNSPKKYDYIQNPKKSGYRGIHDVFAHHPLPHRKGDNSSLPWHGLLVEIQYRTRVQHAWATAVEISDTIDNERTKFSMDKTDRNQFFALCSELLARVHENCQSKFSNLSNEEITKKINELDASLGILSKLRALRLAGQGVYFKKHNVLNLFFDQNEGLKLEVYTFSNTEESINKATELENELFNINTVYVRAQDPQQLRSAYRNYFNDSADFVQLMDKAIKGQI